MSEDTLKITMESNAQALDISDEPTLELREIDGKLRLVIQAPIQTLAESGLFTTETR
jgi:hypothetical protein